MPLFRQTILIAGLGAGIALLAGCVAMVDLPAERLGSARLSLVNGMPAGTAELVASGDQVSLALAVTGIDPGPHGFHLHETGSCRRPDFKSAGGHLNPLGKDHGTLAASGSHLGDLPNLEVSESRTASTTVDLPGTRASLEEWLFDADGTAVVIHAGPDDHRTDPSGNAGPRIACGVVKRG